MIAASSPAFSVLRFQDVLERISQDFEAWEVVGEGRHSLPEIEKDFFELAPSYDLEYSAHAPMSDINIGSLNPRMREASVQELMEGLGAAARMGMDVYTVHPGFMTPIGFVARDRVKEAVRSSLRRLERMSRELGVTIALENMPRSPFSMATEPGALAELMDGIDIGICFDIGHANTMGLIDEFLELKDRFVNIHVHDNMGATDEHLPVGRGTVDFPRLLRRLSGYSGRYVIESRGVDDAVESQRELRRLLD
jgi:sugar phosphate isomerase/epimerase